MSCVAGLDNSEDVLAWNQEDRVVARVFPKQKVLNSDTGILDWTNGKVCSTELPAAVEVVAKDIDYRIAPT
jgi:hypothetical protein